MEKTVLVAFVVIAIILSVVYVRRVRRTESSTTTTTTLEGFKLIHQCCEDMHCSQDFSSDDSMQINGINAWYWVGHESIEEYEDDVAASKQFGFNYVRFNTQHMMTKVHPDPPTEEERDAVANVLKKYYGNNIMPILFSQASIKPTGPIDEQRAWIDFWLEAFPDVDLWDFYNEPIEGSPAFYDRVKELIAYMRTKTDANITIGFHDRRPAAFEALYSECDIISYHFYPGHATLYGTIEKHLGRNIQVPCSFGEVPVETDPYGKFRETLDWLSTYNKTFTINEWGFALQSETTLEECQVCYVKNILGIMKDYDNPNFLGHCFYNSHEPFPDSIWTGLMRYNSTVRPVAEIFAQ